MKKEKIPEFEGEDAYWWLPNVEEFLGTAKIDEVQILPEAVKGLRGQALTWYQVWECFNTNASWWSFIKALIKLFQPEHDLDQFVQVREPESLSYELGIKDLLLGRDEKFQKPEPTAEEIATQQPIRTEVDPSKEFKGEKAELGDVIVSAEVNVCELPKGGCVVEEDSEMAVAFGFIEESIVAKKAPRERWVQRVNLRGQA